MNTKMIKAAVLSTVMVMFPAAVMAEDAASPAAGRGQAPTASPQESPGTVGQNNTDSATVAGARSSGRAIQSSRGAFNEQRFVKHAMQGNQFEIQLGQLAQQKAQSPEVKQFAQQMIQDHQAANQMLMQAASGQSGQPQQPGQAGQPAQAAKAQGDQASGQASAAQGEQGLGPVGQARLQEFQELNGAEFDQAYLAGQLADHVKCVLMYRAASEYAQSPQVKQYASQALPKLQSHLQHVQQLTGWDDAVTASAKIEGSNAGHHDDAAVRTPGADDSSKGSSNPDANRSTSSDRLNQPKSDAK